MASSNTQTNCDKMVEQLESKVKEYEILLSQVFAKVPMNKGVVLSQPIRHGQLWFVSCNVGGNDCIVTYLEDSFIFEKMKLKDLKVGTRVIIMGTIIAAILPDVLEVKKPLPEFELIDWSEIGGHKSQIENIREAIELPLLQADRMKEFGMTPPKGVLLYGEAGCGKTLIAKAIASTYLRTKKATPESFVYVKGAELLSKFVGEAEQRIVSIFSNCRAFTKKTGQRAVLFIDEAEAIVPQRGSRRSSDVDTTIVPTFLSEMDGFEGNNPLVILSTNYPQQLDEAVVRAGRIDLKIHVGRPNREDSKEIFKIALSKIKCADKVDMMAAAAADSIFEQGLHNNISGAAITTMVNNATQIAMRDKKSKGVTVKNLFEVINSKTILQ